MTAVAVIVVLAIAAAATWVGRVIVDAQRETQDLRQPVSRRALDGLVDGKRSTNGTRW